MRVIGTACVALWVALSCTPPARAQQAAAPAAHLQTFQSQRALDALLAKWHQQTEAERKRAADTVMVTGSVPMPAPAPMAAMEQSDAPAESITNVQTQGVDEGGIVKRHGDMLVILRRGRLFTLKVGGDALQAVGQADAYAPGTSPGGTWYDEMLVSGDQVVVIGYSYHRRATEVGLFSISANGALTHLATHYLRSNDYYDSRNYASRLLGSTLIFYTPLDYRRWGDGGLPYPGVATGAEASSEFQRILPAEAIYRADQGLDPRHDQIALHTVTRCELAVQPMQCTATGVLGPAGRTFYVSREAVHVWLNGDDNRTARTLRIPLDGGPVAALQVIGAPIDQLSFLESDDGYLNVLVQSQGRGQGMWRSEWAEGQLALLRTPLSAFGGMQAVASKDAYRFLPPVAAGNRQNRYVGDWLVYGAAPYAWMRRQQSDVAPGVAYAVQFKAAQQPIRALPVGHAVERIEALGQDALLVGGQANDLLFTSVTLNDARALLESRFLLKDAKQGERRTHGFFYRGNGPGEGVLGLPVLQQTAAPARTFTGAPQEQASVLYLQQQARALQPLGTLSANAERVRDDGCKASCVDWYGNARPIFIGPRVFALMGYELVEGRVSGGKLVERRRIDFTPNASR